MEETRPQPDPQPPLAPDAQPESGVEPLPLIEASPEPLADAHHPPDTTTEVFPNAVIIRPAPAVVPAPIPKPQPTTINPPLTTHNPQQTTLPPIVYFMWLIIWLMGFAGVMTLLLNREFDRKFDWNTSYFSIAARNLNREGFMEMRGGIYLTAGQGFGRSGEFYAGHPPMTAWLLAGWTKAFGTSDCAIRALPLSFTVLNLLLLFLLVRRLLNPAAALVSVIICSMLPMTAFYAQNVNMEPFTLTFLLLAGLGYVSWCRRQSRLGVAVLLLAIILGCWTDWPVYLFSGFLGLAHFIQKRDKVLINATSEGDLEQKSSRPILLPLALIIIPLAMFALFMVYLRLHGASVYDLFDRAQVRMNGGGEGRLAGLKLLKSRLASPGELKTWFIELFTLPALLLAGAGALFHLLHRGGDSKRRGMALRVIGCLLLMQITYSLAFPEGAYVHEFWQYYLIIPVSVLAAGLVTWLTTGGGEGRLGRSFSRGLFDRFAWGLVLLIPLMAAGPLAFRLNLKLPGKLPVKPGQGLYAELREPLKKHLKATDVILTDLRLEPLNLGPDQSERGLQFATQWYADRFFILHQGTEEGEVDTRSMFGIQNLINQGRFKGRRILYLWEDEGSEALFAQLNKQYRKYEFGPVIVYLIQGEPDPLWKESVLFPPATTKPSTAPSTGPATKPSTQPVTSPATAPVLTTRPTPSTKPLP